MIQAGKTGQAARSARWYARNREVCLEKRREYNTKNNETLKKYQREGSLRRKYGMTGEQKKQMWLDQDCRCAICHTEITLWGQAGGSFVDHDHETKKVRMLLCRDCNRDLRVVEAPLHAAMVEYLEQWRGV